MFVGQGNERRGVDLCMICASSGVTLALHQGLKVESTKPIVQQNLERMPFDCSMGITSWIVAVGFGSVSDERWCFLYLDS
jgi:hypothetical protein